MFNHQIIWPIIALTVKTRAAVRFHPVEIFLNTSDKDYKTDSQVEIEAIEVCLLETSGHYGLKDLCRFEYDHLKGSFGALTFMRKIWKT
jgi:hypothetical protein